MKTLSLLFLLVALPVLGQVSFSGAKLSGFSVGPPPPISGITNVTSGLVNWWKFDENTGTVAVDSGTAANASATNASPSEIIWVAGKINSALNFSSAASLTLTNYTSAGAGAMSVAVWLKPTNNLSSMGIIYDSDNDNAKGYYLNTVGTGLDLRLTLVSSTGDAYRIAAISLPLNAWTFVVATYGGTITDASTIHIYTNGVEVPSYSATNNGSGSHLANSTVLPKIGGGGTGVTHNWSGIIDDPRVYDRALTLGEITNQFQWTGP